jgi:hypothetical protein
LSQSLRSSKTVIIPARTYTTARLYCCFELPVAAVTFLLPFGKDPVFITATASPLRPACARFCSHRPPRFGLSLFPCRSARRIHPFNRSSPRRG